MKYLAVAAGLAAFLGVASPAVTQAAPVAPFASAQEARGGSGPIEEVRWVRRCHWVRTWRFGRPIRVQRCERVWIPRRPYRRY